MTDVINDGYQTDEIDLRELFSKLWAVRFVILLFLTIGFLIGGGLTFVNWLSKPITNTAVVEVRFNFPSVQKGSYPNGQKFSISDITAPAILSQVYDKYQLGKYNINRVDFVGAIQVLPFATNRAFIEAEFKTALGSKGLSAAEINELNNNYTQALEAASQRFAKLVFRLNASYNLPIDLQKQIVAEIPATWARESIESYGVLDIGVVAVNDMDVSLIENYEYIVTARYLEDYINYSIESAEVLQEDEIGRLLVDKESGFSAKMLLEELDNLKKFPN